MAEKAKSGVPSSSSGKKQQHVGTPPFVQPRGVPTTGPSGGAPFVTIPLKSNVQVVKGDDGSLSVTIPGAGLLARNGGTPPVYLLLSGIIWTALVTALPVLVILSGTPAVFALASVPFYFFGIMLILVSLRNAFLEERLRFHAGQFSLVKDWWGWKKEIKGVCKEIIFVDLKGVRLYEYWGPVAVEREPATWCVLVHAGIERKFGSFITVPEQQFILGEMSQYLRVPLGAGAQFPFSKSSGSWQNSVP